MISVKLSSRPRSSERVASGASSAKRSAWQLIHRRVYAQAKRDFKAQVADGTAVYSTGREKAFCWRRCADAKSTYESGGSV